MVVQTRLHPFCASTAGLKCFFSSCHANVISSVTGLCSRTQLSPVQLLCDIVLSHYHVMECFLRSLLFQEL